MDLWVQLPGRYSKKAFRVAQELTRWDVYHDTCGMSPVNVEVTTSRAEFVCQGCGWSEKFPLGGRDDPAGRHNRAALKRVAVHGKPQTPQTQSAMAPGRLGLALGALVGEALRVRIGPYDRGAATNGGEPARDPGVSPAITRFIARGTNRKRVWPLPAYGATIISGDDASPEGVAETRGEARWTPESSSAIWSPI